jgi:hypothetical protein
MNKLSVSPIEMVKAKRAHTARLANQRGSAGELMALAAMQHWLPRPAGKALTNLLAELHGAGKPIKRTSFDAIHLGEGVAVDFMDPVSIRFALPKMTFIEIKAATQNRVKAGFTGFFFALTEGEIAAAEALGAQHRVALYNRISGELLLSSVPEILSRSRSLNWQLSVQL